MAKRFFYVCAGLFLLAGAYAMGARSSQADSGDPEWFIEGGTAPSGAYVVTASGEWWRYVPSVGWLNDVGNIFGGASGRTIVNLVPGAALTSTGEVWYGNQTGGTWTNAGSPPIGPTPTTQASWGQIKARYDGGN